MILTLVVCAFEPLNEIIIPLQFTEEVKGSDGHIYSHTDYKIVGSFSEGQYEDCIPLDIKPVKD